MRVLKADDLKKCLQLYIRTLNRTPKSGTFISAAGFWKYQNL
jgi:hypothetical protein